MKEQINEACQYIKQQVQLVPEIGIVLGTGLSGLAKEIAIEAAIPYNMIPHFPVSTVKSHEGQLLLGTLNGKKVVAMQGRFHFYEGYTMKELTFPIRVMKSLGIQCLLLSNAAGGVNEDMEIGDIMVIEDHINTHPENPLTGPNDETIGPRFPDMSEPYDPQMIESACRILTDNGIRHSKGVYLSLQGPNLETRAEYHYAHVIGADAIGMSTVPEVIVANHMALPCFAISVIANIGYPPNKVVKVTIDDVIGAVEETEPKAALLIRELIDTIELAG